MAIQRVFLGWDEAVLPRVVAWLGERYARGEAWDLSALTLVVPVRQAGRRLLELLVEAGGDALLPPDIITVGELPERLYEPMGTIADPLRATLMRLRVLREAEAAVIGAVLPHPPERGDWSGWWALASQIESVAADLASHHLRFADVPERLTGVGDSPFEDARWQALATLDERYEQALAAAGLADRQHQRLRAIADRRCAFDRELVLVGVADLTPAVAAMLEQLAGHVTALIHAPESHQAGFDACGGLITDYWQRQQVSLTNDMIHFADRPTDEARLLVEAVARQAGGRFAADQITVGLGDERLAETVRRALELAGLPTRYGAGRPLTRTRPAMLLHALSRFAAGQRFNDFAALLRHPDIETYLRHAGNGESSHAAIEYSLTLLDRYAADHLQGRVDGRWLGSAERQRQLKRLWDALSDLLPADGGREQPLAAWSAPIAAALARVYEGRPLHRFSAADEPLIRALSAIGDALREQAELDDADSATPVLDLAQAIELTLRRLSAAAVPEPEADEATIELMGFLQLALDDAPLLAIAGMNEGKVPDSHTADALLPDRARSALGLTDNARRYARDLFALQTIIHSRPRVAGLPGVLLFASRAAMQGDPLSPSRLLLACADEPLVHRIRRFFTPGEVVGERSKRVPLLLTPGKHDRFLIPPPILAEQPLTGLSVTAFRDYIACPYRFYLKYVLKLAGLSDGVVELDAAAFGNLAHAVLQSFGKSPLTGEVDPAPIAAFLSEELDRQVIERYGRQPRPAVRLQVEQLRQRLRTLARQQAKLADEGWRIVPREVESDHQATLLVDGEPFTITGKIDRIDHHPDLGYRILDYKTSDEAQAPEKKHRRVVDGRRTWVDLQLPLYLDLAGELHDRGKAIALGYLNLPRKQAEVGLSLADWSEADLNDARVQRDRIVCCLRDQVFWPPSDPPTWPDDFTRLCADMALDRETLVKMSRS